MTKTPPPNNNIEIIGNYNEVTIVELSPAEPHSKSAWKNVTEFTMHSMSAASFLLFTIPVLLDMLGF